MDNFALRVAEELCSQAVNRRKKDLKTIKFWKVWSIVSTLLLIGMVILCASRK